MNARTELTLPVPPSVNHYWVHARQRTYISAEGLAYRDKVAFICQRENVPMLQGDVAVTVKIFRPARRGDLDNYLKVLLDSLRGFAYKDDKQVIELHVYRFDDRMNPRAEVEIADLSPKPERKLL